MSQSPAIKPDPAPQLAPYRWQPGQSGNKEGRPNISLEARKLAHASLEDNVRTLIELRDNAKDERVRFLAAVELVNRVIGKNGKFALPVDPDELQKLSDAAIAELLCKALRAKGWTIEPPAQGSTIDDKQASNIDPVAACR